MNAPAEKLVGDVRVLVADVEELIRATAAQSGERIAAARARVQAALATTKDTVVVRTKEAAQATDEYVQENPWTSVGVSAGLGFLIGFLIGRR